MLAFLSLAPINPIEITMTVALTGGQLAAPVPLLDLKSYDRIVFALSGGKDSVAAALALKEAGARPDQIMFIHHEVDGREGSTLMDWAASPGYCRAFADHFGAPLISSWREGGFEGEMLRDNATTGAVNYELAGEVTRLPPSADSDEFGGQFRYEVGTLFRFHSGTRFRFEAGRCGVICLGRS